jgi:pyrimidine-nucleoside phosphorylase
MHSIAHLIARKRDGCVLSTDDIRVLVEGIAAGEVPEYQVGAMLMALYLRGMDDRETADLTMAMVASGDVVDLGEINGFKADKHSTGGVGDKVTLVLGPLVAAAGVRFPKLSGRGLGHTGGTLDKLESIPGFRVDLTIKEFIEQVNRIGLAVTGQTRELVPADAVLYALRDVTATVDSVPLIASSVMSKKIAAGADGIVLDVKCGRGAFMRTQEDASALACLMVAIGEAAGRQTMALVTDMESPLGSAVGNALEVEEAITALRGEGPEDLLQICLLLGAHILRMARIEMDISRGADLLRERIADGFALGKLRQMIEAQGGEPRVVDDPMLLPRARDVVEVPCPVTGYVQRIDALGIGMAAMELGAGRQVKDAPVDHAVGIVLEKHIGERVEPGQVLARIHTNERVPTHAVIRDVLGCFSFDAEPPLLRPHVREVIAESDTLAGVEI